MLSLYKLKWLLWGCVCLQLTCYQVEATSKGRKRKLCEYLECSKQALKGGLCVAHGGGKRCSASGCERLVRSAGLCFQHGGGKSCAQEGCSKRAQAGGLCSAHSTGKRCKEAGCEKFAKTGGLCIAHGGGKRCKYEGCRKSYQSGNQGFCLVHGGGKRCKFAGCKKFVQSRGLCIAHGGGKRCQQPGCSKVARAGLLCTLHRDPEPSTPSVEPIADTSSPLEPELVVAEIQAVEDAPQQEVGSQAEASLALNELWEFDPVFADADLAGPIPELGEDQVLPLESLLGLPVDSVDDAALTLPLDVETASYTCTF
ncbi:MAG: hypothetical protein OXT67_13625 [Zetaproteobacteria bacterium]|nr:hypothetical protein [Zetaproteobacteria bacterium]